jgi:hypothetical protein
MKKQILTVFVLLLFAMNIQAQVTLSNNDAKGNFPKIMINNVRTKLFDKTAGSARLWLYWDQVPEKHLDCKEFGHCYYMTIKTSDNVANRTFFIKYVIPFREPRYENPFASGTLTATFVYKDGRPTKTITEKFNGDKTKGYFNP